MSEQILITGGAGFIGSHLADRLLARGARVRVLDDLSEQVHGAGARRPAYLHRDVELMVGDLRDEQALRIALDGVDAVYHLAARVGVGQSMYRVSEYLSVNTHGTGGLLEALARRPVKRLVVASSMSIYGEGRYRRPDGSFADACARGLDQLRAGRWDPVDDAGTPLEPVPTPEDKAPSIESVYALSKYDQERLCLVLGRAYGIPTVALRFFNVYGPRQALSNPYTGVLAIFGARVLNSAPPLLYEDGLQRRDFVHVRDVARACELALDAEPAVGQAINIGSGQARTIIEVARDLAGALDRPALQPEQTAQYRAGDIRHCFADISRARNLLGFAPEVSWSDGLRELVDWLRSETAADRVVHARRELEVRGLTL